jgi:ADP-heptose:LPS heptosyltransferase
MRTLIVAPDTLAEAVMAQPLVALLRGLDPSGRIDVLADPSVAPVFEAMAEVERVFTSRHAFGPVQPWGKFLLARRLDRHCPAASAPRSCRGSPASRSGSACTATPAGA